MQVIPCTLTYECEYIHLPAASTMSDEDVQELCKFAFRCHDVFDVDLLDDHTTGKYTIKFTGYSGSKVAQAGDYLVYNKTLSSLDVISEKELTDAQGKI